MGIQYGEKAGIFGSTFLQNKTLGKRGTKCRNILKKWVSEAKKVSSFCYYSKKKKQNLGKRRVKKPFNRTWNLWKCGHSLIAWNHKIGKQNGNTSVPPFSKGFFLFFFIWQTVARFLPLQRLPRMVNTLLRCKHLKENPSPITLWLKSKVYSV